MQKTNRHLSLSFLLHFTLQGSKNKKLRIDFKQKLSKINLKGLQIHRGGGRRQGTVQGVQGLAGNKGLRVQVPQPSGHTTNVVDEAVNEEMDDSLMRAATTASSLEAEHDSGNIDKTQSKATPNEPSSPGTSSGGGPRRQETMGDTIAQTRSENVSKLSNDPLLARVLALETTKTTQAKDIAVGSSRRVESSGDEEDLGEDASKQGRRIHDIDADVDITLVNDDNEMFDMGTLTGDKVLAEQVVAAKDEKGDVIKEPSVLVSDVSASIKDSVATTITATFQLQGKELFFKIQANVQNKGKGKMIEPEKHIKKKELIRLDEEITSKLQAEFDKEVRLEREKDEKEQEANVALTKEWDDIQAKIEADHELAQRLQAQEQEELSNNMEGKKPKDLKNKSFDSIKKMFDKAFKRKVDDDKETVELKSLMEVIPDEEEVALDAIPLTVKSLSIVDWKIHKEGKKSYYQIIRADGSSKMYLLIEQYFQVQEYALWDVIENDNSFKPTTRTTANADGTSTSMIPGPVNTEEKAQKKNDVNARSMLLMALPNEHQLTFNQYRDAKTLFDAIQTRFGGNDATRKTQKTLLKKMYENFNAPSTESLDSIFNRLQKIISQLAILDLDTMSIDDLYNNFKIVEQDVKRTITSSSNSNSSSQNMAFVSSPNSTNEVNTVNVQVKNANSPISTADTPDSIANLSDATVYAFLANQPNGSQLRTGKKIIINGSDIAGYDKSKVECFNCHKMGHFARECRGPRNQDNRNMNQNSSRRTVNVEETSSKAMVAIDGAGFDWSFMADEEVPTNMTLIAFSDLEKNEVMFCDQIAVLKRDTSFKDSEINAPKSEIEKLKKEKESNQIKIDKFENSSKSLDKLIGSQISDNSRKGVGFVSYNAVPPPHTGLFAPLTIDLSNSGLEEFQQPEFEGYRPKASKSVCKDTSNEVKKTLDAPLGSLQLPLKGRDVNIAKEKVNTAKPKAVNTARPTSAVVNAVRANQVNAIKGHLQKEDQGYVDSECSRHMTGNMFYLSDFKEFDGGYVTIGRGARGRRITGKGTLKTSKLDFEDVVLLTDTACFVLSPDFKLPDKSQVLLKVPRKNNMYNVDMKNIVPKESLTCLVAKATLDESMLWHRRLGHINFKTINKLVKDNLVRGLPVKHFENDQTCVACLKGKQHKASCKSKIQNSITQPLFMLHMDLFGLTFVSSLMNKKYCLVVTDDYSRFTWVFFLASKDETSGILKNFITKIENLVDKKVKIIRCDNGTKFKNRVMNKFCEKKGIKREFSVARTPQQNGVAERRNRSLIEAATTIMSSMGETHFLLGLASDVENIWTASTPMVYRKASCSKDSDGDDADVHLTRLTYKSFRCGKVSILGCKYWNAKPLKF
ncbi:putative ribonuclease H-like domain-containing protein [Tanacetum coccineum]